MIAIRIARPWPSQNENSGTHRHSARRAHCGPLRRRQAAPTHPPPWQRRASPRPLCGPAAPRAARRAAASTRGVRRRRCPRPAAAPPRHRCSLVETPRSSHAQSVPAGLKRSALARPSAVGKNEVSHVRIGRCGLTARGTRQMRVAEPKASVSEAACQAAHCGVALHAAAIKAEVEVAIL